MTPLTAGRKLRSIRTLLIPHAARPVMFPRLNALQWMLFGAFLLFYGFAVFALTRDYYLRHPPSAARAADPHQASQGQRQTSTAALGARMRQAAQGGPDPAAVDLGSSDRAQLANAADRLFVARRFSEAIPIYRRVLELAPDDGETLNDLGLALHYSGRTQAGLEALQRGTQADPEFQRVWLSLGFVALQSGQPALAQASLERARALDPDNDIGREAKRLLGRIGNGAASP